MKHSSDYKLCTDANSDKNCNIVYIYMTKRCTELLRTDWNKNDINRVMDILNRDHTLLNVPEKFRSWAIKSIARVYSGFPGTSRDQIVSTCKWALNTFIMDDAMEQLFESDDLWNNFGKVFISNMMILFSGSYEHSDDAIRYTINLDSLRKHVNIPTKISDAILAAEQVYRDCHDDFRRLLPRESFIKLCQAQRDFLNTYCIDQPLYKKHHGERSYINPIDIQFTRVHSFNLVQCFAPLVCTTNLVKYFNVNDSVGHMLAHLGAVENDLVGAPKDSLGFDFCPVSMVHYQMKMNNCEMIPAMKYVANEVNSVRRCIELIIQKMDQRRRPVFEGMENFSHRVSDYCFNAGINEPQTRYGWLPVLNYN